MLGTKAEFSTYSECEEAERQEDSAYKDSYLQEKHMMFTFFQIIYSV